MPCSLKPQGADWVTLISRHAPLALQAIGLAGGFCLLGALLLANSGHDVPPEESLVSVSGRVSDVRDMESLGVRRGVCGFWATLSGYPNVAQYTCDDPRYAELRASLERGQAAELRVAPPGGRPPRAVIWSAAVDGRPVLTLEERAADMRARGTRVRQSSLRLAGLGVVLLGVAASPRRVARYLRRKKAESHQRGTTVRGERVEMAASCVKSLDGSASGAERLQ